MKWLWQLLRFGISWTWTLPSGYVNPDCKRHMRNANIIRPAVGTPDDQGIQGRWVSDSQAGNWACRTQELPYRGNQHDISCIPEGSFILKFEDSPKHGCKLYHFYDLPGANILNGRTLIELHSLNLAGDVAKGYVAQALGCVGVGSQVATFPPNVKPAGPKPQLGVTDSKNTLRTLHEHYQDSAGNQQDIILTISREVS